MNDQQPPRGPRGEPVPPPGSRALPPPSAYPPLVPEPYAAPMRPAYRPGRARARVALAGGAALVTAAVLGGFALGHVVTPLDPGQVEQGRTGQVVTHVSPDRQAPAPQHRAGDDDGVSENGTDAAFRS